MIFKKISVHIQYSDGEKLVEYETQKIDEDTIGCWIPSTEGKEFEIAFKFLGKTNKNLDLWCKPVLDGVDMSGMVARSKFRKENNYSVIKDQTIDSSTVRLFSFGKRDITDREDIASSAGGPQKNLNIVCATFEWGHAGESQIMTNFLDVKENGPVHEKAAKKGHDGSAGLGKAVRINYQPRSVTWNADKKKKSVKFIFRYGPEDWLQARGIIPSSNPTLKRERDATPELIDIDELETDDDEVIIVKHMIPAPVAPRKKNKRQKVKQEEQDQEITSSSEEEEDIQPKLEP